MSSRKSSTCTALILGITGAIGKATAEALAKRGWKIRALTRRPAVARPMYDFPVEWRDGDALDAASVIAAAEGVALIFHGVNPPDFQRWREDGLPMLANSISAAKLTAATILFPTNNFVFSSDMPAKVDEMVPRLPVTKKGRVRVKMEQMLRRAANVDGVQVIILRAGDFFGPGVMNSWFTQVVARGGMSTRVIRSLAMPGAIHTWAYVPDLAETFAKLVDKRATLSTFTLAHFSGHVDLTGREIPEAVRRVISKIDTPIKPFPWISLQLGAPFIPFFREVLELTWLWTTSLVLDNGRLRSLIGEEPHTPLDEAVKTSLALPN